MSIGMHLQKEQHGVHRKMKREVDGEYGRSATVQLANLEFKQKLRMVQYLGQAVAVEQPGVARYPGSRVEELEVPVVTLNTLEFKVAVESMKESRRHCPSILAEFLEKGSPPMAGLCSQKCEEIRPVVRAVATVKNRIHRLLLSLRIESIAGESHGTGDRGRVQGVLAAQQPAAAAVGSLFEAADRLSAKARMPGAVVDEMRRILGSGLITMTPIQAHMENTEQLDDETRIGNPEVRRKSIGMQAAALDVA